MSVLKLTAIEGKGNSLDRAEALTEAIKAAVYDNAVGLSVALVVGCIEVAKVEIMQEQQE